MKKKVVSVVMAVMMVVLGAVSAFAAEGDITVDTSGVVSVLSGAFNVTNLLSIITAGLGIALPLILLWFAFRWIYARAKSALRKGN